MERSRDWWVQAQADLRHAAPALEAGDFDWACFASHLLGAVTLEIFRLAPDPVGQRLIPVPGLLA